MNARRSAALLAAGLTLGAVATATPSGAEVTEGTCRLTAQPWDRHRYALEVTVDGATRVLVSKGQQDGSDFPPTSWSFPVGSLTEVRWAWTGDGWGDTMAVTDRCNFTTAYHATPGKVDSVVLAFVPGEEHPTTTTTEPEPTTTSTTAQETTTTTGATTTLPTVPDSTTTTSNGVATTSTAPITTDATTPPPTIIPSTTQVSPTTVQDVDGTTSIIYGTSTNPGPTGELPVTGVRWWTPHLFPVGGIAASLGAILVALRKGVRW